MLRVLDKDGKKMDIEYDGKTPLYDRPSKKAAAARRPAQTNSPGQNGDSDKGEKKSGSEEK